MKPWFLIPIIFLPGCTKPDKATYILKRDGYEEIRITGYRFFACSRDDFYHTGFVARKNGEIVNGVVCEGLLFKGSTIRFD